MPPRLLVVGTVHLDPAGEQKLGRLLDAVSPGCVTVEVSRWGLLFRDRRGPELLRRLAEAVEGRGRTANEAIRALRAMLEEPFEHRASRLHAANRGVRAIPVDLSSISHARLADLEREAFTPENVEQLLADGEFSLSRAIVEQQLLARRYRWDDHLFPWHFRQEERQELARRGQVMARVIAGQLQRVAPRPVVHVGGWHHLVRPKEGGLQTLGTFLDRLGIGWTGLLLGDDLPASWGGGSEASGN
ncbi:MAG: hypothetical protein FJ125_00700 [Deltaproteobacteria bacterium]|nr:hypothetical protein [Deltaproteobacteria bacterium]